MLEYSMSFLSVLGMIPFAAVVLSDVKKDAPVISWETTLEDAIAKSEETKKPILLDFFSPT